VFLNLFNWLYFSGYDARRTRKPETSFCDTVRQPWTCHQTYVCVSLLWRYQLCGTWHRHLSVHVPHVFVDTWFVWGVRWLHLHDSGTVHTLRCAWLTIHYYGFLVLLAKQCRMINCLGQFVLDNPMVEFVFVMFSFYSITNFIRIVPLYILKRWNMYVCIGLNVPLPCRTLVWVASVNQQRCCLKHVHNIRQIATEIAWKNSHYNIEISSSLDRKYHNTSAIYWWPHSA